MSNDNDPKYEIPEGGVDKRVRYYYEQFLQAQDFVDEQNYHLDRQRRLNRAVFSPGILDGLEVDKVNGQVTVSAGTAVDNEGCLIVLTMEATCVAGDDYFEIPKTKPLKSGVVVISFREEQSPKKEGRFYERSKLQVVAEDSMQKPPETQIPLAKVIVDKQGYVTLPADHAEVRNSIGVLGDQLNSQETKIDSHTKVVDALATPIKNIGAQLNSQETKIESLTNAVANLETIDERLHSIDERIHSLVTVINRLLENEFLQWFWVDAGPVDAGPKAFLISNQVTNQQYACFLNAVAKSDALGLYDNKVRIEEYGTINSSELSPPGITRTGESGNYTYAARSSDADHPVVNVNWESARYFCNWLSKWKPWMHSDQQTQSEWAESGSYARKRDDSHMERQPDAKVVLPDRVEWEKARAKYALAKGMRDEWHIRVTNQKDYLWIEEHIVIDDLGKQRSTENIFVNLKESYPNGILMARDYTGFRCVTRLGSLMEPVRKIV